VALANAAATPMDDLADALLAGSISQVLPATCGGG